MTIRGSSYVSGFWSQINCPVKNRAPKWRMSANWGLNIRLCHRDPKMHILHRKDVFDVFCVKIRSRILAVASWKTPKTKRKNNNTIVTSQYINVTYLGSINPWTDCHKSLHVGCLSLTLTLTNAWTQKRFDQYKRHARISAGDVIVVRLSNSSVTWCV